LAGEIDLCTMPVLRRLIRAIEARYALRVHLDLTQVATICADGVRELAYASVHARATCRYLAMVISASAVRRLVAVSGLADRLIIHSSAADAVEVLVRQSE
jgi:anti-anti-sigma factor